MDTSNPLTTWRPCLLAIPPAWAVNDATEAALREAVYHILHVIYRSCISVNFVFYQLIDAHCFLLATMKFCRFSRKVRALYGSTRWFIRTFYNMHAQVWVLRVTGWLAISKWFVIFGSCRLNRVNTRRTACNLVRSSLRELVINRPYFCTC